MLNASFWLNFAVLLAVLATGGYLWRKTAPLARGDTATALLLRAGRKPLLLLLLFAAAWQTGELLHRDVAGFSYLHELLSAFFPFAATATLLWILLRLAIGFYPRVSGLASAENILGSLCAAFLRILRRLLNIAVVVVLFAGVIELINKALALLSRRYDSLERLKLIDAYRSLLDWLSAHGGFFIYLIFFVAITFIFAYLWMTVRTFLRAKSENTKTLWDNIALYSLDLPLITLIVVFGLYHVGSASTVFWGDLYPSIDKFLDAAGAYALIVVIFWILFRLISGIENAYHDKTIIIGDKKIDSGSMHALSRVVRAVIFVIALLTVMNSLGISIAGILAFGGIGGIILGFATKDTLANFSSGFVIFWERPFVIGDWVRIPDINVEGVVENIGWRMTQIRTFDRRPLYVPNSLFSNSVIENPQRMTNRRIYEYIGVRYDDIHHLPALLQDIRDMLGKHPEINVKDIVMVNFDRYGASSLDFFIYVMTKTTQWAEYHKVKEEVLFKIAELVDKHGCEFAFPTRTLHHVNADVPPQYSPPPTPRVGDKGE